MILSAAYALFLYRRIIFGALVKPALQTIQDLTPREIAILAPLVVITIAAGRLSQAGVRRHHAGRGQADQPTTRPRWRSTMPRRKLRCAKEPRQ